MGPERRPRPTGANEIVNDLNIARQPIAIHRVENQNIMGFLKTSVEMK